MMSCASHVVLNMSSSEESPSSFHRYVLQFHVFMCENVRNVPYLFPRGDPEVLRDSSGSVASVWSAVSVVGNCVLFGGILVVVSQIMRRTTLEIQGQLNRQWSNYVAQVGGLSCSSDSKLSRAPVEDRNVEVNSAFRGENEVAKKVN